MTYKVLLRISLCALLLLTIVGCRPEAEQGTQGTPQLTLGVLPAPYSGLVAVAEEMGFFKEAGLDVRLKRYPSGLDAVRAVVAGEAQVATVADIAFASAMGEDPSLRVIAAIGASTGSQLVARKDRGIHKPEDLKGKRVGYSPGTSSHYFLHSFLLTHYMPEKDITMVAIPAAKQVEAVVNGEVDAVSAFDIYAYVARKELGTKAVGWDVQNTLEYQWLLVTKTSEMQSLDPMKRLLKALILAEEFVAHNQEETRSIVARKWDIEPEYLRESWGQSRLFVSFNQPIITGIQSYAKWRARHDGGTNASLDVVPYLDARPLEGVDPRLVTIFR